MNKIIIALIFLLFQGIGIAQENTSQRKSPKRSKTQTARQQINDLHDGVLLVRLQTRKNTIEALRKNGREKEALQAEQEQAQLNKTIVKAVRQNFDFCPVYFFYSDYTPQVIQKQLDQVVFLNDSLQPDPAIEVTASKFFTAEYGPIGQDTTSRYSHTSYTPGGDWSMKKEENYYGGTSSTYTTFSIKSDQMIRLHKPFPYYAKTLSRTSNMIDVMVKKLNTKLHKFYAENKRR